MPSAIRDLGRALRFILATLGLLFVVVTFVPVDGYLIGKLAGPWNDPKGDILIVPGAESMNDAMGASSFMRAIYAVRTWRQGGFRQIVLSGGSRNGGSPIAEQMRDYLMCQGIPASSILLEEQSQSTHENAVYIARLLAGVPGRKVLLTSDYHMFRAYRTFRKAGLDVAPRPFPESAKRANSWTLRWPVFLDLCVEMAKSGYYRARGWL
jgi:uncharacterized SAM-binding protein YcdF (DUF218 family)